MKDIKREYLPPYSLYDRAGIAAHLTEMAEKGWLLEKLNGWYWTYRRTEPKTLHFTVAFFPKATQFAPDPAEGLETYRDFCAEAGWVLAASNAQMQIFYNEQPSPTPMETDPEMTFETICRTMRGGTLGGYWCLLLFGLAETVFFLFRALRNPIAELSSVLQLYAQLSFLPLILLSSVELTRYGRWKKRARAALAMGAPLPELRSPLLLTRLMQLLVTLELAALAWFSLQTSGIVLVSMVSFLLFFLLTLLLTDFVRRTMQRLRWGSVWNRLVTLGIVLVMTVGMLSAMAALVLHGRVRFSPAPAETYEYNGQIWEVYHDALPVTIQDLTGIDDSLYSTRLTQNSSPLLTHLEARQHPRLDAPKLPQLSYEIVIVKAGFLYSLCKQDYLDRAARDNDVLPPEYRTEYRPVDAAPWGADTAYREYTGEEAENRFLLCWADRMAEVRFASGWDITPDLMKTTGDALKNA